MTNAERKRFIYINYMMKRINDSSDGIYESMADSDEESVRKHVEEMKSVCNELLESISDEDSTENKA